MATTSDWFYNRIMSELETAKSKAESRLDGWVALSVAVVATFMALCNIKDGNIVQGMAQAQAHAVSKWSQYQSKSTKQNLAESSADSLDALKLTAPASALHVAPPAPPSIPSPPAPS